MADFAAIYTKEYDTVSMYRARAISRVLRWCAYQMTELVDYKHEIVLLFLLLRIQLCDILDGNKYLPLHEGHETAILKKRKEYDCHMNREHTVKVYLRMCTEDHASEQQNATTKKYDEVVHMIGIEPKDYNIEQLSTGALTVVIKQHTNVMSKYAYCAMMHLTRGRHAPKMRQL